MPSCCSTSPFNTPSAGNVLVVPPGSTVVATPTLGCGGESVDAVGAVSAGGSLDAAAAGSNFLYPTVKTTFTVPAIGSSGGFYSENAVEWAIVGALAWIAPLGYITITGISGLLVSFTNYSIPAGTSVNAASPILIMAPPPPSSAALPADGLQLTRLRGFDGVEERLLPGVIGQLLRHNGTAWKPFTGKCYLGLDEAVDITPSGFNPYSTSATTSVAVPLTLPNLPSPQPAVFHADLTLVIIKTGGFLTALERQGRTLVAGTPAGTYAASATIRCTNSTPQLDLTKLAGAANITLKIYVNGYYV